MFFFGDDTSLVVDFYVDKTKRFGPKTAEIPWSEMEEKDIENTYIRARIAYQFAKEDNADEKVLEALKERILETFRYAASASKRLAETPYSKAFFAEGPSIDEYKRIADEVRHPSSADAG